MTKTTASQSPPDAGSVEAALLLRALEAVGRGVIVADESLRVTAVTPMAARLLGAPVKMRAHLVRVLCPDTPAGPVAEALASGVPVRTTIPGRSPTKRVRVHAARLRTAGRAVGWIVRLTGVNEALDSEPVKLGDLWTRDPELKRTFALAEAIGASGANVLLLGDAGTGKASLAAAIHARGARSGEPLRTLVSAVATPSALEKVLLGASASEAATLFLDDVIELPHDSQRFLLRALESGLVTPLGGSPPVRIAVRILSGTRAPFGRAAEEGRFDADLLYRLRTVSLTLPPLRARCGDVRLLVTEKLAQLNRERKRQVTEITDAAWARLEEHDWPGNVRELHVAIEHAHLLGRGPTLLGEDLPQEVSDPLASPDDVTILQAVGPTRTTELVRVAQALERAGGDRRRAAAMLGMSRSTLWRRMRALGLIQSEDVS